MSDDQAREVIRDWEALKGDRATTERHWQEVCDFMLPDRADYTIQRAAGVKRQQKVYDSTALYAVQQASAGLHSYMTSATERFAVLQPADDRGLQDREIHAWFEAATDAVDGRLRSPALNFATQSHEHWNDQLTIGTSCMAVLEGRRGGILFSTRHMRENVIAEDDEDRVNKVVRHWQFTAKQAAEAWGSAAGPSIMRAYDEAPGKKFTFLHRVRPRRSRDPERRDARHKPFESVYVCLDDMHTIGEGGFDEFPFLVPRFSKAAGEIYGRSQGMTMLPHVKMLNAMMQTVLMSAQQNVDPPLQLPDDTYTLPIRTTPGSKNYYRAGSRDRIEPLHTGSDTRLGIEMINSIRQDVLRGFFVDWMVMPSDLADPASSGKGVTATYTLTMRDQKFRLMSPLLARMRAEFLNPLIERVFNMLWRQSVALRFGPGSPFPPPPPQMTGMPWRVEYISPAEIAQRTTALDNTGRLVQTALMLAQVDPNVPNTLDADRILRDAARSLNTPALQLRDPQEVAARQQQQQEAQQRLAGGQALQMIAGAARDGGAALKNVAEAQEALAA